MARIFRDHSNAASQRIPEVALGKLEMRVMEILWSRGRSSVHDVLESLGRKLAYTTVMTTLSRLFSKGLLAREKSERAFVYSAQVSRQDWERQKFDHVVSGFLTGPAPSRELLLSFLLDAVSEHDAALLDDLEKRIRAKRRELSRKGQP